MLNSKDLKRAIQIIKQGGVVAAPTETAYGLIADAMNARAVKNIFLIKGRKKSKPLPLIAASLSMVKNFFYLNSFEEKLARRYWPGPLTILLRPKKKFPIKLKLVAVRVSSSPVAKIICLALSRPITATSANLSGKKELYSDKSVTMEFSGRRYKPDFIFPGGRIPKRKPSTIVEARGNKIIILRQGAVKFSISNF